MHLATAARSSLVSLRDCEAVIARGQKTFVEVGQALLAIRDGRLYKKEYKTFEQYCRDRWKWSKTHVNRLIAASEMAPTGVKTEREARRRRQESNLRLVAEEETDDIEVMRHPKLQQAGDWIQFHNLSYPYGPPKRTLAALDRRVASGHLRYELVTCKDSGMAYKTYWRTEKPYVLESLPEHPAEQEYDPMEHLGDRDEPHRKSELKVYLDALRAFQQFLNGGGTISPEAAQFILAQHKKLTLTTCERLAAGETVVLGDKLVREGFNKP